jgi:hypothetical protein
MYLGKLVELSGNLVEIRGRVVVFGAVGRKTVEVGSIPSGSWNYYGESW